MVIVLLVAALAVSPARPGPTVDDLAWMAGCWASIDERGKRTEECWTAPEGGLMIGLHRELRPDKPAWFEFLRIEQGPDGVAYLASPGGKPPTAFPLASLGERQVIFENPEHDFPQRIVYRREGDILHARVEGEQDGETQGIEWSWRRVPFPAGGN